MKLLDLIFPRRCVVCKKGGSYLCPQCFANLSFDVKPLCLVCNRPTYNFLTHPTCKQKYLINGCFSAIAYNKTAKKLVAAFKYKPYLTDLQENLTELFYESIIQNESFQNELEKGEWIFVPIPLFPDKLKKRGYNQAEILSNNLSKKFNLKSVNLLKRVKDTKTQVGKSNIDRKLNIKGAFQIVNSKLSLENKNVFLVDDVVTTGSTLKEAASVLKREGVRRVLGLTFARD